MAAPQYVTIAQLITHIDERLLGQLTSDTGTAAAVDGTNTKLVAALERASSDVESYALRGESYKSADLAQLQTDGDATLTGLVADLVLWYLFKRRGGEIAPAVDEARERAYKSLEQLRDGARIFGKSLPAAAAGKAETVVISQGDRLLLRMVSDEPYFPVRNDRVI